MSQRSQELNQIICYACFIINFNLILMGECFSTKQFVSSSPNPSTAQQKENSHLYFTTILIIMANIRIATYENWAYCRMDSLRPRHHHVNCQIERIVSWPAILSQPLFRVEFFYRFVWNNLGSFDLNQRLLHCIC